MYNSSVRYKIGLRRAPNPRSKPGAFLAQVFKIYADIFLSNILKGYNHMSIYNFSVLKSNPLVINIPNLGKVDLYRIKFHGKETYPGLDWFGSKSQYKEDIQRIEERALRGWKGKVPEYGIDTPGYEGKLDFSDPIYKNGLDVYKLKGRVAWQECDGIEKVIGTVKKVNNKLVFIAKDESCQT